MHVEKKDWYCKLWCILCIQSTDGNSYLRYQQKSLIQISMQHMEPYQVVSMSQKMTIHLRKKKYERWGRVFQSWWKWCDGKWKVMPNILANSCLQYFDKIYERVLSVYIIWVILCILILCFVIFILMCSGNWNIYTTHKVFV